MRLLAARQGPGDTTSKRGRYPKYNPDGSHDGGVGMQAVYRHYVGTGPASTSSAPRPTRPPQVKGLPDRHNQEAAQDRHSFADEPARGCRRGFRSLRVAFRGFAGIYLPDGL